MYRLSGAMHRRIAVPTRALLHAWRQAASRYTPSPIRHFNTWPRLSIHTSCQVQTRYLGGPLRVRYCRQLQPSDWWSMQKLSICCSIERRISVTETSPPPVSHSAQPIWTDPSGNADLDIRRRIFCNRSLTMDSIKAVGFDMDYTLAQYKADTFELLAFEETKRKLVTLLGYPSMVLDFEFDCTYIMRGLVIDKRRGNVLKVDRHKYAKIAYHGFAKLSAEERHGIYGRTERRDAFDEPDYTMIDTLFSISEAYLFASLVDLKERRPDLLQDKSFMDIYTDVRYSVDYCHRDGTLKKRVAENPGKYIHEDSLLVPLFEMLRQSGKRIFLATNSLWDYTNIAMNYLLHNKKV